MSANAVFSRIVAGHVPCYDFSLPYAVYESRLANLAEQWRRAGRTHVMVNNGLISARQMQDPDNYYLRWAKPMHALDEIVPSDLTGGVISEALQNLNQDQLRRQTDWAVAEGFRPAIFLVEPYYLPEGFYARYPDLRGPRVDYPKWSRKPLYAPCLACEAVVKHYRQMGRRLLELAPAIDEIHVFTNDSGAGICYSRYLYPGVNGPCHCREVSPARHLLCLLEALRDGGRTVNPGLRIVQLSGLHPIEWKELVTAMPEGVHAKVNGALSWSGGLEDHWGTLQVGRALEDMDREVLHAWQRRDFEDRVVCVRNSGREVYASLSLPPGGFEALDILRRYREFGVEHVVGGPSGDAWDLATEVWQRFRKTPDVNPKALLTAIASEWAGPTRAERLVAVWRTWDSAQRERPMLGPDGNELNVMHDLAQGPIVPDFERLETHERDYYRTAWMKDLTAMRPFQGGVWRQVYYEEAERVWYLERMRKAVFARVDAALAILKELLSEPALNDAQRECLETQRRQLTVFGCDQRHAYHWILAAGHAIAGNGPAPVLSLREIISAEIENERQLLRARAGMQDVPDNERIRCMLRHRDDPPAQVDLSAYPAKGPHGLPAAFPSFAAPPVCVPE